MPPGIIADINSVSARQRDKIGSAQACALICIKARVRGSSAVRWDDRSERHLMMPASPPANFCISIPFTHRVLFVGAALRPPLADTLEHFWEM
jgi:hypothetical protein